MHMRPQRSTIFPYTTLFRSDPKRLTPEKPSALHANAQPYAGDGVLVLSDRDRDMAAIARVGLDGAFSFVLTPEDRKSTRLNSSHTVISYAVFCLNKKT